MSAPMRSAPTRRCAMRSTRGKALGPRMQVSGPYLTIPHGGGDLYIPDFKEPAGQRALSRRRRARSRAVPRARRVPGRQRLGSAQGDRLGRGARVRRRARRAGDDAGRNRRGGRQSRTPSARKWRRTRTAPSRSAWPSPRASTPSSTRRIWTMPASPPRSKRGDVALADGRLQRRLHRHRRPKAPDWPEEFLRKNIETTEIQRQAFTKAVKAGVPIVFATDSGVFPHGLNARQFPIMVERGMTPMQADPVRHRAWPRTTWAGDEDVGTIEAGQVRRSHRGARRSAAGHLGAAERRGGGEGRNAVQDDDGAVQLRS